MKRMLAFLLVLVMTFSLVIGCSQKPEETPEGDNDGEEIVDQDDGEDEEVEPKGTIILSTTTSTQDSGLLEFLLPEFTKDTGYEVDVVAVGTGKALENGENGEADVLLVHAKASEEEFVANGFGLERKDVMYNDFVVVGPTGAEDIEKGDDIEVALATIKEKELGFVSRGDDSGTHKKELQIWEAVGVEPGGDWYMDAGAGMGDVLTMANEKEAYTITDRATYLSMKNDLDLEIFIEGSDSLLNQYGIIPVNPENLGEKAELIDQEGAYAFMDWFTSERGQELISQFGIEEYGQPLFFPNAE